MKKHLSKPLVITNIIVIFVLLIASIAMIITTNNGNHLNYEAKLVVSKDGKKIDDKIADKCLVITKLEDINNFKSGDYIVYQVNETSSIAKINTINSTTITYIDKNGKKQTLDIDLKLKHPKIILSSNFLGTIFYTVAAKENISLTYILIVGIFIISMLSLAIVYMSHIKKKAASDKKDISVDNENTISIENDDTIKTDNDNLQYVLEENEIDEPNVNEIETVNTELQNENTLSCELLIHKGTDNNKLIKQDENKSENNNSNNENDDIPSIDSLIDEIDTLNCK